MKTTCTFSNKIKQPVLILLTGILCPLIFFAQVIRPFNSIYSNDMKGGHVMFGNTSMTVFNNGSPNLTAANYFQLGSYGATSIYTNNSPTVMGFVDIDADASTVNSSSADLILPAGSNTIKFARLYWGGRVKKGVAGANNINLRTIKIRKGTTGAYAIDTASIGQVDKMVVSGTDSVYQSYVDITNFVNGNGAGTYTVADIAASTGSSTEGYYAGWSIVVAYENPSSSYSGVRIYDGFVQLISTSSAISQSIVLSDFNAPSNALADSDAYMTVMGWEGDADRAGSSSAPLGDYIKINGNTVSNAVNPSNNFWNGTISNNGVMVTTKNPNYANQFGIDIDMQNVGTGYGILPNATNVTVTFGTQSDYYYSGVFAFSMKIKDPQVTFNKTVADSMVPYHVVSPNEALTYTMSGKNIGAGDALKCVIVDTIPANVTYIPGSLKVLVSPVSGDVGPKTDVSNDDNAFVGTVGTKTYVKFFIGAGANATTGGTLHANDSFSVSFRVRAGSSNSTYDIVNIAKIVGSKPSSDSFSVISTAVIGAQGGPLPVKLSSFTVKKGNRNAVLDWTTATELNSSYFEIQQSTDGMNFSAIGTVKAQGTTFLSNNYEFLANTSNVSATTLYYRLKEVDINGDANFSKTISLTLSDEGTFDNFTLYPNPFISNISMKLYSENDVVGVVRIINLAGQLAFSQNINLQKGMNVVVLNNLDGLAKGIYMLEFIANGKQIQQKVIKQ